MMQKGETHLLMKDLFVKSVAQINMQLLFHMYFLYCALHIFISVEVESVYICYFLYSIAFTVFHFYIP